MTLPLHRTPRPPRRRRSHDERVTELVAFALAWLFLAACVATQLIHGGQP